MKYYLYIDECGDHNLKNYDEPNMAYEIIKNNIYTENLKQVGIKIIPHT